ncbi:hypothetical protein MKS88_003275 [Plasmodium brasilianum]|uniref:Uncharacterized protein n=1 Tax=Plasmodium brasilianum TaxID=5824 RepID=A0ACB9Y8X2_PLABR|nr:hypothetical protein MKS88_003275 [Plasmodium brasilianum]
MKTKFFMVYQVFSTYGGREKLPFLKKLSYDFYIRSKKKSSSVEKSYEEAISINKKIVKLYNDSIYNNQSYILILKGLMNILLKIKEKKKKIMVNDIIKSFVSYFTQHIPFMNEQDVTLLLDIKGKCNIHNKKISESIISRLNKNEKNTLFYSLNCKSVCIILNNLYKMNDVIYEKKIIDDIYYFYIFKKYSNFTLKQSIILLHSLNKYSYEKSKIIDFLNYISLEVLKAFRGGNHAQAKNGVNNGVYNGVYNSVNNGVENNFKYSTRNNVKCDNIKDVRKIEKMYEGFLHYEECNAIKAKHDSFKASEITTTDKRRSVPLSSGEDGRGGFSPFDEKEKFELIFFYTLSCYNYCNNSIIHLLGREIKKKLFSLYKEKEICMFINSVCNFFAFRKTKNFEKHGFKEEEYINEENKKFTYHLIHILLKDNKELLENYSHFGLISIYIFLSKLNYFYDHKHEEAFFLTKLFLNDVEGVKEVEVMEESEVMEEIEVIEEDVNEEVDENGEEEKKKKKKKKGNFFFFCGKSDLTAKTLINLLFSFTLNCKMNAPVYDTILRQLHVLLNDHLHLNKTKQLHLNEKDGREKDEINKLVQFLTVQNIQLLCIIYTYLFVYNILFKLEIQNLRLFLFFINNFHYLSSMYLSQHVSSKIHKEINATIFSIRRKRDENEITDGRKKRFLLTNECFIFPYYVDIYLKEI